MSKFKITDCDGDRVGNLFDTPEAASTWLQGRIRSGAEPRCYSPFRISPAVKTTAITVYAYDDFGVRVHDHRVSS